MKEFKYDAFISYRRKDGHIFAERLRSYLLNYKIPHRIASESTRKRPSIYLDRIYGQATEDFFAKNILPALRMSRWLIIINTPGAREPRIDGRPSWIEREIAEFGSTSQCTNVAGAVAIGAIEDPFPADLRSRYPNLQVIDIRGLDSSAWKRRSPEGQLASELISLVAAIHDVPSDLLVKLRRTDSRDRLKRAKYRKQIQCMISIVLGILSLAALVSAWVAWRAMNSAQLSESIALRESARVLRVADKKRLDDLKSRADALWPASPSISIKLKTWLEEAHTLLERLPEHQIALDEIRDRGTPSVHPRTEELMNIRRQIENSKELTDDESLRSIKEAKASEMRLVAEIKLHPAYAFLSDEDSWWHEAMSELVVGMEKLAHGPPTETSVASVQQRLHYAEVIEHVTFQEYGRAWDDAIQSIADSVKSPKYGGLRIKAQLGLVPIGQDEKSGLWEFCLYTTHMAMRAGIEGRPNKDFTNGIILVLLPGGSTWVGSQRSDPEGVNYDASAGWNERPHLICVDPFLVSKYELTQAQWMAVTGNNPAFWSADDDGLESKFRRPIENVSWDEIESVLRRLGLRFPTEDEWEYACRAGTTTTWWSGISTESLRIAGNVRDESFAWVHQIPGSVEQYDDLYPATAPVGSFIANPFGLYDTHGNVFEFCVDGYVNRPGDEDGMRDSLSAEYSRLRVRRGGSYAMVSDYARSAARYGAPRTFKEVDLGVRPARSLSR